MDTCYTTKHLVLRNLTLEPRTDLTHATEYLVFAQLNAFMIQWITHSLSCRSEKNMSKFYPLNFVFNSRIRYCARTMFSWPLARLAMLSYGLDLTLPNYYSKCVNQAICIFIIMRVVFCYLVSVKFIITFIITYCARTYSPGHILCKKNGQLPTYYARTRWVAHI